jgi:hypothetical protein
MSSIDGTLTLADLQANRFQTVFGAYDANTIIQVLQRDLDAHNVVVRSLVTELCEISTDRQRIYGTSADGEMNEADEFDRGVAYKNTGGSTVAFPLRKFTRAIGWTRDYMMMMTPADLAESFLGVQRAHVRQVQRQIQRAIFNNANYTFREQFMTPLADLAVKALVNADGAPIPDGPNNETFDGSTHTHYDFLNAAAPTQAAALALINDVVEHGHGNAVKLAIPRAAEDTVRSFANFTPYLDPRLTLRSADAPGVTVDISRIDNRAIGLLGAAEVWVKSWVPSGYLVVYDAGEATKPLVFRQHQAGGLQGLRIAARLDDYPLYADQMESYFGIGVWNRTAAAVLYYNAGAVAYVAPTL